MLIKYDRSGVSSSLLLVFFFLFDLTFKCKHVLKIKWLHWIFQQIFKWSETHTPDSCRGRERRGKKIIQQSNEIKLSNPPRCEHLKKILWRKRIIIITTTKTKAKAQTVNQRNKLHFIIHLCLRILVSEREPKYHIDADGIYRIQCVRIPPKPSA